MIKIVFFIIGIIIGMLVMNNRKYKSYGILTLFDMPSDDHMITAGIRFYTDAKTISQRKQIVLDVDSRL